MKKVMLALMAMVVLMFAGCTTKTVDFIESSQVDGQHEKALKFLGEDKGTLVYKDSAKAKECKRAKMKNRGYWIMQDEVDCFDNEVRRWTGNGSFKCL